MIFVNDRNFGRKIEEYNHEVWCGKIMTYTIASSKQHGFCQKDMIEIANNNFVHNYFKLVMTIGP